ncbi:MAG: hypothetical protein IAE99_05655 [Rhodothermales bacterium]|nr:hypothetical protein [Rhodothermales bacterium]
MPFSSQMYPNTPGASLPRNREQTIEPVSHTGVQASTEAAGIVKDELARIEGVVGRNSYIAP